METWALYLAAGQLAVKYAWEFHQGNFFACPIDNIYNYQMDLPKKPYKPPLSFSLNSHAHLRPLVIIIYPRP